MINVEMRSTLDWLMKISERVIIEVDYEEYPKQNNPGRLMQNMERVIIQVGYKVYSNGNNSDSMDRLMDNVERIWKGE